MDCTGFVLKTTARATNKDVLRRHNRVAGEPGVTVTYPELVKLFFMTVPFEYPTHMLCYFATNAAIGEVRPFVHGLCTALRRIEEVSPGYAKEMLERIAAIRGKGEDQYEAILQLLAEIYVTEGAAVVADRGEDGRPLFRHEPTVGARDKNPEFESRADGIWYAVEVKTPKLIDHSRKRTANPYQLTARLPPFLGEVPKTLPRDNPVKDFLISAEAKFEAYSKVRPDAYRILTIVWDDFCNEPITALLHPMSGLLTPNSFHKDKQGGPVSYPHVDAVLICRYQHQIIRSTREEPLIDNVRVPFEYRHAGFPYKALIGNPAGRAIPDALLHSLNAVRQEELTIGAEYNPMDLIFWVGGEAGVAAPTQPEERPVEQQEVGGLELPDGPPPS